MFISEDTVNAVVCTIVFVVIVLFIFLRITRRDNFVKEWMSLINEAGFSCEYDQYRNENRNLSDYQAMNSFLTKKNKETILKAVEKRRDFEQRKKQKEQEEFQKWKEEQYF